jgi:hypothetical protein
MAQRYKGRERNYKFRKGDEEKEDENDERGYSSYSEAVTDILSKVRSKDEKDAVRHLLSKKEARASYEVLSDTDHNRREIRDAMISGLRNFQKGKPLSQGAYAIAVAQEVGKNANTIAEGEQYREMVNEMYDKKIISESQRYDLQDTLDEHIKDASYKFEEHLDRKGRKHSKVNSGLEELARMAAAIFIIVIGAFIVVTSVSTMTGAAIGATESSPTLACIFGFLMFIFGLVAYPRN